MARKLTGVVMSDVQDKTITVAVSRSVTHPVYGKRYTVTKKFAAHDEKNEAHIGDKVEITETRPVSKRKSFALSKVIETGHATAEIKDETVETVASESSPSAKASGLGQATKTRTATGSTRVKA